MRSRHIKQLVESITSKLNDIVNNNNNKFTKSELNHINISIKYKSITHGDSHSIKPHINISYTISPKNN